jgi:putative oxidoreductase
MASGFLLPAAGAAYVGLMLVAAFTDHKGKGFFVFKGGWEYVALVVVFAACLVGLGPGRWSIDRALGLSLAGLGWAGAAVGLGGQRRRRPCDEPGRLPGAAARFVIDN